MNKSIAPLAAAIAFLSYYPALPALAQSAGLPSTSMGRIGRPGDNQYTSATQATRHGGGPAPAQAAAPPPVYALPWAPTPRPARPDPSIEPIAADEPISPAGFPPLPDRLELPVQVGWSPSGGGGGGGGSGAPTGANGAQRAPQGEHQHYQHYQPGAFAPPGTGSSGGGSTGAPGGPGGSGAPGAQGEQPRSSGYYKVRTPEEFNSNPSTGGPGGAPGSEAGRQLRALGREPKLQGDTEQSAGPPQAVTVNQSTTQDLSLPEDDFQRKGTPLSSTSRPSNVGRAVRRVGQTMMNRAYGMSSGMGSMMTSGMHF